MGYLTPEDQGYYAVGYDEYNGLDIPVWYSVHKTRSVVAAEAAEWVMDAIEIGGHRVAKLYYMTDMGKVEDPDVVITSGRPSA